MSDNRFIKLTEAREQILRLAEYEGAIDRRDVARDQHWPLRTAIKALNDLHKLGLLKPTGICEFVLSPSGRAWLDAHPKPL